MLEPPPQLAYLLGKLAMLLLTRRGVGAQAARESGDGSLRFREAWRLAAALVEAEDLKSAVQLSKVPHHPYN